MDRREIFLPSLYELAVLRIRCRSSPLIKQLLAGTMILIGFTTPVLAQSWFSEEDVKFSQEVEGLLLDRKYGDLDQLAERLRRDRPVFPSGGSHLHTFYDSLTGDTGRTSQERLRHVRDRIEQLEGWKKASESVTPRIALASARNAEGSLQRGGEFADKVSDDAMMKYQKAMVQADRLLVEAERRAKESRISDPQLYEEWMTAGIGLGFNRQRMFDLLDDALSIDPWWFSAVRVMTIYLLPQWHGEGGELPRLAEYVVAKTKAASGEAGYAEVAMDALHYDQFREFSTKSFGWERTRTGIEDWLKQAPDSPYRLGQLLRLARLAGDREAASDAVRRLKGRWHKTPFPTLESFLRAERWSRPDFREGQARLILEGFKSGVHSACFLDNGSVVMGIEEESLLRRFRVQTGEPLESWKTELTRPDRSTILHDGSQLLLAGLHRDKGLEIVSISTKNWAIESSLGIIPSKSLDLVVDHQGRYIATSLESGVIRRWERTTPPQPYEWKAGHTGFIRGLAFSPQGSELASVGGKEIVIWDLKKRSEIRRWQCHNEVATTVRWSPDGKLIATAGAGNEVRLWNAASGESEGEMVGGNTSINTLEFTTDGSRLVGATRSWEQVGIPGEIIVWSMRDKTRVATLTGHALGIWKIVISPDNRTIASASEDGTVRLWELP